MTHQPLSCFGGRLVKPALLSSFVELFLPHSPVAVSRVACFSRLFQCNSLRDVLSEGERLYIKGFGEPVILRNKKHFSQSQLVVDRNPEIENSISLNNRYSGHLYTCPEDSANFFLQN